MPRPYTEKRKKANQDWDAANLDRISIALPKDRPNNKEIIKDHALQQGESVNAFIIRAIDETIERDKNK